MDDAYTDALSKMRWAVNGVWSVPLTPEECKAVLAQLEGSQRLADTLTTEGRKLYVTRVFDSNDPGDETDED